MAGRRSRRRLAEMHARALNFDPHTDGPFTPENGWRVDDLRQALVPEPPGPPGASGTWQTARRLMRGYEFADPSIVRAHYDSDEPLEGRTMVLELRYHGLRFHVGVRVGDVYEHTCEVSGREARVWGWNYRTLEGHLERGQMAWEVWKWCDSGNVEFRIHAFSRRAEIANPLVRIGFRLLGRREQLRFLHSTLARMQAITAAALREDAGSERVSRLSHDLTARHSGGDDGAHERLADNLGDA